MTNERSAFAEPAYSEQLDARDIYGQCDDASTAPSHGGPAYPQNGRDFISNGGHNGREARERAFQEKPVSLESPPVTAEATKLIPDWAAWLFAIGAAAAVAGFLAVLFTHNPLTAAVMAVGFIAVAIGLTAAKRAIRSRER